MTAIEDRVRKAASEQAAGDWLDVVRRSERLRRRMRRLRMVAAVAAALLLAVPAFAVADRLRELLVVSSTDQNIPMAWISGDRAYDVGGKEEVQLASPLPGVVSDRYFSPAAILSPGGGRLLYHAIDPPATSMFFSRGINTLRLYDFATGADHILEHGAQSIAWRADGALAYAKAPETRTRRFAGGDGERGATLGREIGHVVVRSFLGASPERWTDEPSDYTAIAWAGKTLLIGASRAPAESVQRLYGDPTQAQTGVYALTGPGQVRKLPLGGLLAVNPTGEMVLGTETSISPVDVPITAKVRVVRLEDGKVLSELDLPPVITPERPYSWAAELSGGGSWAGNYIVLGYQNIVERLVVVLRFEDGELNLAHVFKLEKESAERAGVSGFYGPRFVDKAGREIVAWATSPKARFFLRCDRLERRCSRSVRLPRHSAGTSRPGGPPVDWPAFLIENPSRPLAE
jgi:hypothetical protein